MKEIYEFKFRPELLIISSYHNLKFTDSISKDAGVGVYAFLVGLNHV